MTSRAVHQSRAQLRRYRLLRATLTPRSTPRPITSPTSRRTPTIRSAMNGSWSSPADLDTRRACPPHRDVVSVTHAVTYDTTSGDVHVIGIEAGGAIRFAIDLPDAAARRDPDGAAGRRPGNRHAGCPRCWCRSRSRWCSRTSRSTRPRIPISTARACCRSMASSRFMGRPRHRRSRARRSSCAPDTRRSRSIASVSGWRAGDRVFLPDTRQVPANHWFNLSVRAADRGAHRSGRES